MLTEVLIAAALLGAAPPVTPSETPPAAAAAPQRDAAPAPSPKRKSAMIGDETLKASRGGEVQLTSTQILAAVIGGNVIDGNYTAGAITLSENALSGFNGLGNVLINSGAQNSLQSGMSVVINVTP